MTDKTEAIEHVIHSSMPIDFERRYAMDNLIAQDADLIETLREVGRDGVWKSGHNPATAHPMCVKAADRIEQLEREKAVVSDLWEQQKEIALDYLNDCNKAADRIEALEEDIERLRDRVKKVENNNRELRGSKERVYAATDLRQPAQSDVERVARALAQADGIEICSDATYALSSYGHKAQAALAAMRQPTQSDAESIEALEAEIERLKNQLSLETEPSPYCPICGSCGDKGCCGSKRCMYPDTATEALSLANQELHSQNERLREALNWYVMDDEKYIRAALEQSK